MRKIYLLVISLVCFLDALVAQDCRVRDSIALVALYNSTDGPNWERPWDANWNGAWDLNRPMDEWQGITLNDTGCCTEISLAATNLNGYIPDNLSDLKSLRVLNLQLNELDREIPVSFSKLLELDSLDLSNNNLEGGIPDNIGNLRKLKWLDLMGNNLEGTIPLSVENLDNLTTFNVFANQLEGTIPIGLFQLNNIHFISLSSNKFTGKLPDLSIFSERLITFFASENNLMGCFPIKYLEFCDRSFQFINNPGLPWGGDFQRFCNGEEQIGAPCDDGDPNTENDVITDECECRGVLVQGIQCNTLSNEEILCLDWVKSKLEAQSFCADFCVGVSGYEVSRSTLSGQEIIFVKETCGDQNIFIHDCDGNLVGNCLFFSEDKPADCVANVNNAYDQREVLWLCEEVPDCNNECTHPDYDALMTFYSSTNGNNWNNTINNDNPWDKSCDPCDGSWYGIQCENGRVTCIDLDGGPNCILDTSGNNLDGTIPYLSMSELKWLMLSGNSGLTGEFPDLNNNEKLEVFRCDLCQLEGTIPNFTLQNLRVLSAANNSLSGNLPNFNGLPSLKFIRLNGNQLEGPLPSFSQNSSLEQIWLHTNNFSGTIPNYSNLILTDIHVNNNELSGCFKDPHNAFCNINYNFIENEGLPWNGYFQRFCNGEEQIGAPCSIDGTNAIIDENCECVPTIDPCENAILECPRDTTIVADSFDGSLTLYARDFIHNYNPECSYEIGVANMESGDLPYRTAMDSIELVCDEIADIHGIIINDFECFISVDIDVFADCNQSCRERDSLALMDFYFTNGGSDWKYKIDNDTVKYNWQNEPMEEWHGVGLNEFGCVISLNISGFVLSGDFDSDGDEEFRFFNAGVRDTLSQSLGKLSYLEILDLTRNEISGKLPDWLGSLSNLRFLFLSENEFDGIINDTLKNLEELEFLYLGANRLSGVIPEFICDYKDIHGLDFGGNNFDEQSLLACLREKPDLEYLYLSNCNLRDTVPVWFCDLENLKRLNLAGNPNLIGAIPSCINRWSKMRSLWLWGSGLSGTIPEEICELENLFEISLSDNDFSGVLPACISEMTNLEYVYFNDNEFTGIAPNISNDNLNVYWLQQNKFTDLPDLSSINTWRLNSPLKVENNKVTFKHLLKVGEILTDTIFTATYAPQDSFFRDTTYLVKEGDPLVIDLIIDEDISSNEYIWYKDGVSTLSIIGQNKRGFTQVTRTDVGCYNVDVVNPNLPDLTLHSRDIKIELSCLVDTTYLTPLVCLDDEFVFGDEVFDIGRSFGQLRTMASTGCDSIIDIRLDFYQPFQPDFVQSEQFCEGDMQILSLDRDYINYTWSTGAQTSTISITQAGAYSVTVTDSNGCTAAQSIEMVSVSSPDIDIDNVINKCPETNAVDINLPLSDAYTYSWSGDITSSSPDISVGPGVYNYEVTNQFGCSTSGTVQISNHDITLPQLGVSKEPCLGEEVELFVLTPVYDTYQWSTGEIGNSIMIMGEKNSTSYSVIVQDNNGCAQFANISVSARSVSAPDVIGSETICESVGSTFLQGIGDFDRYEWYDSDGSLISSSDTIRISRPGVYELVGIDQDLCQGSRQLAVFEEYIELADDTVAINVGTSNNLKDLLANDIIPDLAAFEISNVDSDIFVVNRTTTDGIIDVANSGNFVDPVVLEYSICSFNCGDCKSANVYLINADLVDITQTNIITPNQSTNNTLRFNNDPVVTDSELQIFNRWGDQIYRMQEYDQSWAADGYPGGTYFYVLKRGNTVIKKTLTVVK